MLKADIQRIGEVGKGTVFPGDHFGIATYPDAVGLSMHFQLQAGCQPVTIGIGVNFIAHLDQPGHILSCSKTGIDPKNGLNRKEITSVIDFKRLQLLFLLDRLLLATLQTALPHCQF